MFPKAYMSSHSRMSGSRWVITPWWLSGSWRSFLYSSSLYSCYFFLISSVSVRSISFLSFTVPIFECCSLGNSNFLEEISSLSHLLVSSISLHLSLMKAFYTLLTILWNSAFKRVYLSFSHLPFVSLLLIAICKASSDNHLPFLHFFFLGMVFITASCTMSWTSILSSWGTLSDLIPWIYLSPPLNNDKGFDLGHTWMV